MACRAHAWSAQLRPPLFRTVFVLHLQGQDPCAGGQERLTELEGGLHAEAKATACFSFEMALRKCNRYCNHGNGTCHENKNVKMRLRCMPRGGGRFRRTARHG